MKPDLKATPRLAPGVRLNEKAQRQQSVRLQGPSLEIVQLCDGQHTVQQIGERVHSLYPKAEPGRVTDEVVRYLEFLHRQQAIEF
jgi:Coenzyme PQQ synthesis protein D (PqqD)